MIRANLQAIENKQVAAIAPKSSQKDGDQFWGSASINY
jgi:hypothetical protein